ncbi:MAG: hypothetical protein IPP60_06285 [Sphingobacteriales bacterium]|nr:hypothetical protein [Sphingobacteriales bacterium]
MAKKEIVHKEEITYFLRHILDIAGNEVKQGDDFEKQFARRLKFQSKTDWKRYRASIDLLDDTEFAIISAFEYQLGDLSNGNRDSNGMYLRLYGILNAVYLQISAFEELACLLNYSSRDDVTNLFKQLDIYKLRNIAGAHTLDYQYDTTILENETKTSFRIYQCFLEETGNNISALSQHGKILKYNLLNILNEYEEKAKILLIQMVKHAIKYLVHDKNYRVELIKQLDEKLKNLIDYSRIDKNKTHTQKKIKEEKIKLKKLLKESEKLHDLAMIKIIGLND